MIGGQADTKVESRPNVEEEQSISGSKSPSRYDDNGSPPRPSSTYYNSKHVIDVETQLCLGGLQETTISHSPTIKSFVFLDLESSALDPLDKPKITEICLMAVHRSSIDDNDKAHRGGKSPYAVTPRVVDKLCLCVYPNKQISLVASDLTGLDNPIMVENEKQGFNDDVAEAICAFLKRQSKPVCIVAHNGEKFDFQLLRTELDYIGCSLPCDILCCDSLIAFRKLDEQERLAQEPVTDVCQPLQSCISSSGSNKSNKTPFVESQTSQGHRSWKKKKYSYKLSEVYCRRFGNMPENQHNAESDVMAMLQLVVNYGNEICKWMDRHAKKWTSIGQYYVPSPQKKTHLKL